MLAAILSGFFVSSPALDLKMDSTLGKNAGEIQFGPVTAYPSMKIITRHNDNLFQLNTGKKSTLITIVAPAVKLDLQDNIKKLTLDYEIEAGFHDTSGQDDYVDQELKAGFAYNPTDRIKTEFHAEYLKKHDSRGTGRTEGGFGTLGGSLNPDEWHSYGIGGLFSYGTPNATGRVEFETAYTTKEYDNNRQFTFDRDLDDLKLRGTFFYRIRPKTQLLFEIKQTEFDYQKAAVGRPSLDSTDRAYLFGVAWDATYKTTGVAKFGVIDKDFDSALRTDADNFAWEVDVKWMPRTYSTVNILTERRQDETDGIGDSIVVSEIEVSWNHLWRSYISSTVGFLYGEDSYDPTFREDTRFNTGLKINYEWRRWAKMSAGYRYEERDSNVDVFDYEQNLFEIRLDLTL
jgi:hypothetical protein